MLAAAKPLDVGDRDGFLQAVAAALQSEGKIGPGVVRRVCAKLQRQFFDPPDLCRAGQAGAAVASERRLMPSDRLLAAPRRETGRTAPRG